MHGTAESGVHVDVLGRFALSVDGQPVRTTATSQRIIASLVVAGGTESRGSLWARLWPENTRERASSNLRAGLARLPPGPSGRMVLPDGTSVRLSGEVSTDLWRARARLHHLRQVRPDQAGSSWRDSDIDMFSADLLPLWDEQWLTVEREHHRQVRLHALEALSDGHRLARQFTHALRSALAAVAADPLRESAHRRVVAAHLAEENVSEAARAYCFFRDLLRHEMGLEPSATMTALVDGLVDTSPPPVRPRLRAAGTPASGATSAPGDRLRREKERRERDRRDQLRRAEARARAARSIA